MTNLCKDREFRDWIDARVIWCQSLLVDELLKREIIWWDEVTNLYDEEEDEYRDVYEWWLVESWLLDMLEEHGSPVLRTDFGSWWGRPPDNPSRSMEYSRIFTAHSIPESSYTQRGPGILGPRGGRFPMSTEQQHHIPEQPAGRVLPLAVRADVEELLEWELWRTYCDLYRYRWGVTPAPIVQQRWSQSVRTVLIETMPARPKERGDELLTL